MPICKSPAETRKKLHFSHIPNADLQTTGTTCPLEGVRIHMFMSYCLLWLSNTIPQHQKALKFRLNFCYPAQCIVVTLPLRSFGRKQRNSRASSQSIAIYGSIFSFLLSIISLCLVCRTGDLVLISPHFLALGCQLPVLHRDDKSYRYQTTSPSLGGSPGPGSGRPQSQRLQTTLSERRLKSLTEANLRQTRNQ